MVTEISWADFLEPQHIWWHRYVRDKRGKEYAELVWATALLVLRTKELAALREENHNV